MNLDWNRIISKDLNFWEYNHSKIRDSFHFMSFQHAWLRPFFLKLSWKQFISSKKPKLDQNRTFNGIDTFQSRIKSKFTLKLAQKKSFSAFFSPARSLTKFKPIVRLHIYQLFTIRTEFAFFNDPNQSLSSVTPNNSKLNKQPFLLLMI